MRSPRVTTVSLDSIEQHRNSSIARGHSENTAKAYSTDLRMFLAHHQTPEVQMMDFETKAQTWLNLTRKTAAPSTTRRRLTSLRSFAKWARWETELDEYKSPTPAKTIPHPIPERLEGLEKLIKVAGQNLDQRTLVGACGFVGLRVSEARAIHTSWFNLDAMTLRVRGKGDKERVVPVSPRAWDSMSHSYVRAMRGDGFLTHYEDRSARKVITRLGERAQLRRPIASHDLRATYATILSENGVNPRVIQELLGHSSLETTEIYMGVKDTAMHEAVNF